MIIYPPLIAETIPAFTTDKIIIPFSQNPAVDINEVTVFKLIIKNYITSEIIADLSAAKDNLLYDSNAKSGEVTFITEDWKPQAKQYYKFQMSYSDDTINPDTQKPYTVYSAASIGRCIGNPPEVYIENLDASKTNEDILDYIGKYKTDIVSEPVYSYRFIFSQDEEIIQDTGEILHDVENDNVEQNKRISTHLFRLWYELEDNITYKIKYIITSINGYKSFSEYKIIKAEEKNINIPIDIIASQSFTDKENGCINLSLKCNELPTIGDRYLIQRTENNGKKWDELVSFVIQEEKAISIDWKDYTVIQGNKYTYSIRKQYKEDEQKKWSQRKLSNTITPDFEYTFLSDGDKQLRIQFNSKVSSFKDVILEQKIDTIGGQYPFIVRNGQVKYKEIPISGLISHQMDNNELFVTNEELGLGNFNRENNISFTGDNVAAERKFKLELLNWLNNGKPKLFRSPTEGNYIVRIINVSLSPNDTLGRMIHSFSSTAYEIMDNNIDNLYQNNLINFQVFQNIHSLSSTFGSFLIGLSILGG